jgi:hypothetical protein
VIDPASNEVFAVADTLNGSTIEHKLYAFDVANGALVPGFPVDVEPPGDDPAAQAIGHVHPDRARDPGRHAGGQAQALKRLLGPGNPRG